MNVRYFRVDRLTKEARMRDKLEWANIKLYLLSHKKKILIEQCHEHEKSIEATTESGYLSCQYMYNVQERENRNRMWCVFAEWVVCYVPPGRPFAVQPLFIFWRSEYQKCGQWYGQGAMAMMAICIYNWFYVLCSLGGYCGGSTVIIIMITVLFCWVE